MTGVLIEVGDAEEYSRFLSQIGEGIVKLTDGWVHLADWGLQRGFHELEGLTRRKWRDKYFGHLHLAIPERREAVAELAEKGRNNSEIADTIGVDERTVRRDLNGDSANAEREDENGTEVQVSDSAHTPHSANAEREDEPLWPGEESTAEAIETEPDPELQPEPLKPAEPGWHALGNHVLYCGDSTDAAFIDACKGVFAFADPPYNAGKAEWDDGFEWQHDYLAEVADIVAVTPGIAALKGFHTVTDMPYQWSIAAEITNGMTRGALGFGNWIYVALFSNGSLYRNAKDYLRVPAHTGDDKGGNHAARKPLRLLTELIGLFTSKGDTVIDPFLGSGTTLIAAERTGRRCIGAEINPMHCAEIIARYNSAVE